MIDDAIQRRMVQALYAARFEDGHQGFNWASWGEGNALERDVCMVNFQELGARGFAKATAIGGYAEITTRGVLLAEEQGLAVSRIADRNREVRFALLDTLSRLRQEKGVMQGMIRLDQLCKSTGVSKEEFLRNKRVLIDVDYMESVMIGTYRITSVGMKYVAEERRRQEISG